MSRRSRNNSLLDLLACAPWPVGVVAGFLVLFVGRVAAPGMLSGSGNPFLAAMGSQLGTGALNPLFWLLAGLCWVAALLSAVGRGKRRQLLEAQSSLATLRAMRWQQFEQLVSEAYRRDGYSVEETGQGGADGGVDLVLRRDGQTTLVQCKQWRTQRVGVAVVREQFGLLTHHQAQASIIVTVGDFTEEAKAFAKGKPMTLVDGPALLELVKSVQAERTDNRGVADVGAVTTLAASVASEPLCPVCSSAMVRRKARKTGAAFFGCSRYPACRGTRELAG